MADGSISDNENITSFQKDLHLKYLLYILEEPSKSIKNIDLFQYYKIYKEIDLIR